MFLKIVRSAQGIDYVYVVEGYRDSSGIIRHKYLFSLGKLEDFLQTPSFQKLARRALGNSTERKIELKSISEGKVVYWGHSLIKKLWDSFEFDRFFNGKRARKRFDIARAVFYMTARHMMLSDSKLGMYESRIDFLGFETVGINHLYRALDVLAERKEEIEEHLFQRRYNLFNSHVDVVFYDVTTVYFESQREDVLRKYGFSKDGKIGSVQIVLGLLIDKEGFPIGYEIFPGNSFDGKTLIPFLEKIKKRFSLNRIILVADRGINSKLNLLKLREMGFGYIVALRLRNASEEILKEVFNQADYKEVTNSEGVFKYKTLRQRFRLRDEEGKLREIEDTVVVSYSDRRAERDRAERQRLIQKAIRLLETPSAIEGLNKRGGKKYIKAEQSSKYFLDEELIERDRAFEGYYAIQSSEENLKAEQILEAYHSLWKIEESFRIMKHTLEIRPVYHWSEQRIKGHLVVCFLSFLFMRMLEEVLSREVSAERIREALRSITFTEFSIEGVQYYLRNKMDRVARELFKGLKVAMPENITEKENFKI
ncbi:IS1634 family transposase [Thermodesulfovibrio yellowstonii]|uniref:Transposase n=1 Tax=Thermodesulfovibrio yellowstonii TaxID=28262 RepID=A0A9W6LKP5_9BACT|nr:IS1634 family transposase [Thermodesulfovibrio islandicus]GLI53493.1 transposase [Thermodesulfovibrio islandicus]